MLFLLCFSQSVKYIKHRCFTGEIEEIRIDLNELTSASFNDNYEFEIIFRDFIALGWRVQGIHLAPNSSVDNACATMINGDKYIFYNPEWIKNAKSKAGTNWAVYFIVAHEYGHHDGHHFDIAATFPNHQQELYADYKAGYMCASMGASLEQTLSVFSVIGSKEDSDTHPNREKRLIAAENGWRNWKRLEELFNNRPNLRRRQ